MVMRRSMIRRGEKMSRDMFWRVVSYPLTLKLAMIRAFGAYFFMQLGLVWSCVPAC